eukprot:GILI01001795.1.p1 GENE.GILI01001795.1~~GILI01001795.1.p1  ORF type:complete len:208 (+),score=61.85 GILI01001795.1:40-663(+)
MAQYGKSDYWEERYSRDPEPFDWYQRWGGLKDIFLPFVQPSHRIIMVGAGNSRLSEEMWDEGFHQILNIDISRVVVKAMEEKYRDKPGLTYMYMDARNIDFPDGSFDVAVDKGTMDALLCGENSTKNVQSMVSEVYRVLAPGGVYLIVSYGQPDQRTLYLEREDLNWEVKVLTVPKPTISGAAASAADDKEAGNVHYIYVCTKRTRA